MIIFISALSVLLGLINPFFGVSVFLGLNAPELVKRPRKSLEIFLPILIAIVFIAFLDSEVVALSLGVFLIGLPLVFIKYFRDSMDIGTAFFWSSVYLAVISSAQFAVLGSGIIETIKESNQFVWEQGNITEYKLAPQLSIEQIKTMYFKFADFLAINYTELWLLSIGFGLIAGVKIFLRKIGGKYFNPIFVLPVHNTYMLIVALILYLIPDTIKIGQIILVSMAPMYLMQGLSVASFFWRPFLQYFKRWRYILYIALFISPYALATIACIGAFDSWFDFRKIRKMEESDENNSY